MQTSLKKLPKSQVELTLHIPYAAYAEAEKQALQEANQHLKIDGFRPGHIPEQVVRQNVNPEYLKQATLDHLLPKALMQAAKENNLNIVAPPKVDVKTPAEKEGDETVIVATMDVMPEVTLGNYQKIKVKKKPVEVEAKQVDETLAMIMDRFAVWKDITDRPAKMGDRVEVDFEGFDEKGEPVPNTQSKNHPVILGSKSLIPGFEEELVGLKTGDEKEFNITFPKDYHAKEMQGQKVTFKVKIGRLEEKEEQTLNEAMVEQITGEKQSPEEFRKSVEEDLRFEMTQRMQAEHDQAVVDEIVKITQVDLPESLVKQELDEIKEEKKRQLAQQGLKWEQYLSYMKKSEEEFDQAHKESAEYRLKARFGVHETVKALDINITQEDAEKEIQARAEKLPAENHEEFKKYYASGSEGRRMLMNNMAVEQMMNQFTEDSK